MSHVATAWAYRQQISSAGRKFVLVALADFADETWSCFPGQERLAEMTGQSVRSVREHLAKLEADGLIERGRRALANGQRTSDRYRLKPPADLAGSSPDERQILPLDNRQISSRQPARSAGEPLENHQPSPLPPRKRGARPHCAKHQRRQRDCIACGRAAGPTLSAVPETGDPRCPQHAHELAHACRTCAADRKAGTA